MNFLSLNMYPTWRAVNYFKEEMSQVDNYLVYKGSSDLLTMFSSQKVLIYPTALKITQ